MTITHISTNTVISWTLLLTFYPSYARQKVMDRFLVFAGQCDASTISCGPSSAIIFDNFSSLVAGHCAACKEQVQCYFVQTRTQTRKPMYAEKVFCSQQARLHILVDSYCGHALNSQLHACQLINRLKEVDSKNLPRKGAEKITKQCNLKKPFCPNTSRSLDAAPFINDSNLCIYAPLVLRAKWRRS